MSKINATYGSGYYLGPDADYRKLEDERTLQQRKRRREGDGGGSGTTDGEGGIRQTFAIPFDMLCLSCQRRIARGTHVYTNRRATKEKYLDKVRIWELEIRCKFCHELFYLRTDPETPKETGGYLCVRNCRRVEGDFYAINKLNEDTKALESREKEEAALDPLAALERENEASRLLTERNRETEEDVEARAMADDVELLHALRSHAAQSVAHAASSASATSSAFATAVRWHAQSEKSVAGTFVPTSVCENASSPDKALHSSHLNRYSKNNSDDDEEGSNDKDRDDDEDAMYSLDRLPGAPPGQHADDDDELNTVAQTHADRERAIALRWQAELQRRYAMKQQEQQQQHAGVSDEAIAAVADMSRRYSSASRTRGGDHAGQTAYSARSVQSDHPPVEHRVELPYMRRDQTSGNGDARLASSPVLPLRRPEAGAASGTRTVAASMHARGNAFMLEEDDGDEDVEDRRTGQRTRSDGAQQRVASLSAMQVSTLPAHRDNASASHDDDNRHTVCHATLKTGSTSRLLQRVIESDDDD